MTFRNFCEFKVKYMQIIKVIDEMLRFSLFFQSKHI